MGAFHYTTNGVTMPAHSCMTAWWGLGVEDQLIWVKGAVSYRFSQGLLTLMCNHSKLKADINFFFFLLRRQTSKVYNWLQKITIQHPVALLKRLGQNSRFS